MRPPLGQWYEGISMITGSDIYRDFLFKEDQTETLKSLILKARNEQDTLQIRGTVKDEDGNPMTGATVTIPGTTLGTISDASGNFKLNVPPSAKTLSISFVGMTTQTIKITGNRVYDIILSAGSIGLGEVVAIGYGTQKKTTLVGSVSDVKISNEISSRSITNVSSGLAGLAPGLSVIQSSGMAGSDQARLQIRGLGTLNGSYPLIVVDGMPGVDINTVNINDIESISVLKDAVSAALYGSRAANGVILVTTKNGKGKKANIQYSGSYAVSQATNYYKSLVNTARDFWVADYAREGMDMGPGFFSNGVLDEWLAMSLISPHDYPNTNWWDYIFRNAIIQRHNVSASGGNEKTNYYFSVGVLNQEGVQVYQDFKQYNFRSNIESKIRDNITVGTRLDGNWSTQHYSNEDGVGGIRNAASGVLPYDPETGRFGGPMTYRQSTADGVNPLARMASDHNTRAMQVFHGNIYGEWEAIKGLKIQDELCAAV